MLSSLARFDQSVCDADPAAPAPDPAAVVWAVLEFFSALSDSTLRAIGRDFALMPRASIAIDTDSASTRATREVQPLPNVEKIDSPRRKDKHLDKPYRSGKRGDVIKVKCVASESFFIVGYERSRAGGFRSLLLGAYRCDQVVHVGSVRTGFRQKEAAQLRSLFDMLPWKRKQPPVLYSGKRDVVWILPTLIAEIDFRGWTSDGKLRHSS